MAHPDIFKKYWEMHRITSESPEVSPLRGICFAWPWSDGLRAARSGVDPNSSNRHIVCAVHPAAKLLSDNIVMAISSVGGLMFHIHRAGLLWHLWPCCLITILWFFLSCSFLCFFSFCFFVFAFFSVFPCLDRSFIFSLLISLCPLFSLHFLLSSFLSLKTPTRSSGVLISTVFFSFGSWRSCVVTAAICVVPTAQTEATKRQFDHCGNTLRNWIKQIFQLAVSTLFCWKQFCFPCCCCSISPFFNMGYNFARVKYG